MLDIETEQDVSQSLLQSIYILGNVYDCEGEIEWDRKVGVRQHYTVEYRGYFKGLKRRRSGCKQR